ncbi:MAG: NrsF family protein [Steroidobacteraceae bacterium]
MKTENLTALLATNLEPVDSGRTMRRYVLGIIVGGLAALILAGGVLHLNPELPREVSQSAFWIRELFCASLGALAVLCVARLGRPGARLGFLPTGIATVVLILWIMAARSLVSAAAQSRVHLLMGSTFAVCPFLIALISAPLLISFVWILKDLAPTRLRWAGAGAGFAAGSIGALVYTLHCPELATPFIAIWYLLGILIPTAIGVWLGPRLLRW